MALGVALALLTTCTACTASRRAPPGDPDAQTRSASMVAGTVYEMEIHANASESWDEGGLRVLFRRVVADSRCAVGGACDTPGNAIIDLVATRDHQPEVIRLRLGPAGVTGGATPESDDRMGFRFQIVALSPEPIANTGAIDPASYGVTVRITKL